MAGFQRSSSVHSANKHLMLSVVSCLASFKALWERGSQLACGLEQGPACSGSGDDLPCALRTGNCWETAGSQRRGSCDRHTLRSLLSTSQGSSRT